MGMQGHLMLLSKDEKIFSHVHPIGTVSMASIHSSPEFKQKDGTAHMMHGEDHKTKYVEFPFIFPQSGLYRMWTQLKINDEIVTGVFDLVVE